MDDEAVKSFFRKCQRPYSIRTRIKTMMHLVNFLWEKESETIFH